MAMTPDEMVRRGNWLQTRGLTTKAKRYYRRAAKAGDARGMWGYASLLARYGDFTGRAAKWRLRAAEHGHIAAVTSLARQLEARGDDAGAERWYREAAEHRTLVQPRPEAATQRSHAYDEGAAGVEDKHRKPLRRRPETEYENRERLERERRKERDAFPMPRSGPAPTPYRVRHHPSPPEPPIEKKPPRKTMGDAVAEAWNRHRDEWGGGS